MKVSERTIDTIKQVIKILPKLPENTIFGFSYDASLQLEARTQEEVKQIRRCFRGLIWKKEFVEWSECWNYSTQTKGGLKIKISGVSEGPKQCKMVVETVMEERSVPIGYKKEMVEVKKTRYICPENDKS